VIDRAARRLSMALALGLVFLYGCGGGARSAPDSRSRQLHVSDTAVAGPQTTGGAPRGQSPRNLPVISAGSFPRCVSRVPISTNTPASTSRRLLVESLVGKPGASITIKRPGPKFGFQVLGRLVGVPTTLRTWTAFRFGSHQADSASMAAHRGTSSTINAYLRRGHFHRISTSPRRVLWSNPTQHEYVETLPGVIIVGRHRSSIGEIADRIASSSALRMSLAPALEALANSDAGLAGASTQHEHCALGRWAELTAKRRVRMHFTLGDRYTPVRVQQHPERGYGTIVATRRTSTELMVNVKTIDPERAIDAFVGPGAPPAERWRLHC
jgi:hypothetical protein